MKRRIVTLMWGAAWGLYGKKFIRSFHAHWPKGIELQVITDKRREMGRAQQIRLKTLPSYRHFMGRWRDDKSAQGYGCTGGHDQEFPSHKIKPEKRYWKKDAVKWAPQAMAPYAAIDGLKDGDIFCWLDADVVTIKDVPLMWLDSLLKGHDVACLKREEHFGIVYKRVQHSEIGFWAARIGPKTRRMIQKFSDIYASGEVFDHREWHSGYIFDRALDSEPSLKIKNLNSKKIIGNPWRQSKLNKYMKHKMGKRKYRGLK